MGAPLNTGALPDTGACDEIKEFSHEGDLDAGKNTDFREIKTILGLSADSQPLSSTIEFKGSNISPLVIEVASRIKQDQLRNHKAPKQPQSYSTGHLTQINNVYTPNMNMANPSSSYPRPTWTTPMIMTSSQSTFQHRPPQPVYNNYYPHYAYNNTYHQGPIAPAHSAAQPQPIPPAPSTTSTKSKGKNKKKSTHIKKPLNAFMLYMKEMRAKVVQEYTLKESAAINQILGKRWHALDRSEQARFYEMARRERALHMQMYPNWSARSNYASVNKKKRKRDKGPEQEVGSPKKCRARYGLDKQSSWCKPCRRKKKCVRYLQGNDDSDDKNGPKCDADTDSHKPSCPAAHEPGCNVRGADCDCNTHTCEKALLGGKTDDKDCTCSIKKEEDVKPEVKIEKLSCGYGVVKTPNVVITSPNQIIVNTAPSKTSHSTTTSLHIASVANLSLTCESSPINTMNYTTNPYHVYPHHVSGPAATAPLSSQQSTPYAPQEGVYIPNNTNILTHLPY